MLQTAGASLPSSGSVGASRLSEKKGKQLIDFVKEEHKEISSENFTEGNSLSSTPVNSKPTLGRRI